MSYLHLSKTLPIVALSIALSACGGDDNDGEIDDLQTRLNVLEADAANTETTLLAEISALEARLAELQTESDANNAANDAELLEISAEIAALEDRLAAAENVVASTYEITLVNVTANQPIAPAAVMLHEDRYFSWQIGAPASLGIEIMSESGSPATLLADTPFAIDSTATDGLLMPGASTTVTVSAVWQEDLAITIAAMPVNTNDAFSGTTAWNISSLDVGMSKKSLLPIYDAGTEANTETAATMPGPAAGGEGYNPVRDDIADVVARHNGVVTSDDGLATSALDESHRFDQGALYVTVTRVSD